MVTSRKGRVSRNPYKVRPKTANVVTSRKGRVSRNNKFEWNKQPQQPSRPVRGV